MSGLFIETAVQDPVHFVTWVLLVVFSICVHEYAHAAAALRLGDDTAARLGHLTLNPMVQMGGFSLLMLAVAGIAWGAVPVNPSRLRGYSRGEALVAAAGPLANLGLSLLFLLAFLIGVRVGDPQRMELVLKFFATGALLNAVLLLFNLIPAPPLDGWKILTCFVRPLRHIDPTALARMANIALIVLLLSGVIRYVFRGALYLVTLALGEGDRLAFILAVSR
jgi:Zn-dependent protease